MNNFILKALTRTNLSASPLSQVAIKEKMVKQRNATKLAKQNAMAAKSAASGTAGALDRFAFGK